MALPTKLTDGYVDIDAPLFNSFKYVYLSKPLPRGFLETLILFHHHSPPVRVFVCGVRHVREFFWFRNPADSQANVSSCGGWLPAAAAKIWFWGITIIHLTHYLLLLWLSPVGYLLRIWDQTFNFYAKYSGFFFLIGIKVRLRKNSIWSRVGYL